MDLDDIHTSIQGTKSKIQNLDKSPVESVDLKHALVFIFIQFFLGYPFYFHTFQK